jgi:hypothetical protein
MINEIIMIAAINISLGYLCWFYLFRRYFIDSHRHELFKLRYKLFDFALDNDISFENEAFQMRWKEINSMIKLTHETHLMFISGFFRRKKMAEEIEKYSRLREEALNSLSTDQKAFFENSRHEQSKLFFAYIIKSSLVFMIVGVVIVIILAVILFLLMIWKKINFSNRIRPKLEEVYDEYELLSLKTT